MIALLVFIWWAVGVAGFIYWWTSQFDLRIGHVIFAVFVGSFWPVTWLAGKLIHDPPKLGVVMRARKAKR